jgi:orotidine-5'-phosphate decarboxylase
LYEKVLTTAIKWGTPDNLMFVIGATQAEWFERIRQLTPDNFYLVPVLVHKAEASAKFQKKQ